MLSHTNSLFSRTLFFLLPFVVMVVVLYNQLVLFAIQNTEDHIAKTYLQQELSILEKKNSFIKPKLPYTSYLEGYWDGDKNLPEHYQQLPIGVHEVDDDKRHLLIANMPNHSERVYLVLNEAQLTSLDQFRVIVRGILLSVGGLVVITGCIVAVVISRTLTGPVTALADDVTSKTDPDQPYYGSDRKDEIGILSNALNDLVAKLHAVLSREKAFSRHTSHELRTPVAVITNALAVLDLENCSEEKRKRNMGRIRQANNDIENLIDVFLRLGKHHTEAEQHSFDLQEVIDSQLERMQLQIQSRDFIIDQHLDSKESISASSGMLAVLLRNLLTNALTYGAKKMSINYDGVSLTISNPIEVKPSEEVSHGYGLEIVERICLHQGWELTVNEGVEVFTVCIGFNK